jgi:hypothetical protein
MAVTGLSASVQSWGHRGGLDVRYGRAQVDVDLAGKTAAMVPGSLEVAEQRLLFPPGGSPVLGSGTTFDAIRDDMMRSGRVTIALIHGFSNSFTDAIERAAWIVSFYGIDANMFVFSWPSIASPMCRTAFFGFGGPVAYRARYANCPVTGPQAENLARIGLRFRAHLHQRRSIP